jgi:ribosome biogenesis protein ENP2
VIEAPADINDVAIASDEPQVGGSDSGLLLFAGEQERVMSYYVPQLGLAPRWCSFLDAITEELEEGLAASAGGADASAASASAAAPSAAAAAAASAAATTLYDGFRFVTREELDQLGMLHLIGDRSGGGGGGGGGPSASSAILHPYMHGFFIDADTYDRVRGVLDPSAPDRARRERVRSAVEGERGSRIALYEGSLPKVNRELAARLHAESARRAQGLPVREMGVPRRRRDEEDDDDAQKVAPAVVAAGAAAPLPALLADDRFSRMFSDPSFEIDVSRAEEISVQRGAQPSLTKSAGKRGRGAEARSGLGREGRKG